MGAGELLGALVPALLGRDGDPQLTEQAEGFRGDRRRDVAWRFDGAVEVRGAGVALHAVARRPHAGGRRWPGGGFLLFQRQQCKDDRGGGAEAGHPANAAGHLPKPLEVKTFLDDAIVHTPDVLDYHETVEKGHGRIEITLEEAAA